MFFRTVVAAGLLAVGSLGVSFASGKAELSTGQTVYVSVYSNVFSGPKAQPVGLDTILSIRNTDLKRGLTISTIDYYDTEGRLLRRHLPSPIALGPLGTKYLHVREKESAGGPGSNFIVRWESARPINAPIIETVMISARGGQGISFIIPGQVIVEE